MDIKMDSTWFNELDHRKKNMPRNKLGNHNFFKKLQKRIYFLVFYNFEPRNYVQIISASKKACPSFEVQKIAGHWKSLFCFCFRLLVFVFCFFQQFTENSLYFYAISYKQWALHQEFKIIHNEPNFWNDDSSRNWHFTFRNE